MQPTPIYEPANLNPAYQLRFSWTGFPARGTKFPADVSLDEMDELISAWESDGIRLLEHRWLPGIDRPPAPGSAHRVLTYDAATDTAIWEGTTIHRNDPIPE